MTFGEFVNDGLFRYLVEKYEIRGTAVMFVLLGCLFGCVAAGYLLGSLNSAVIFSRSVFGKDIRESGSKNAGMTNMFRVFGKKGGLLTLAGDVLKTALAVAAGVFFYGRGGAYLAGFFCMLGHMFPCYYRFRGGKGMLVCSAVLLFCDPPVFFICLLVFAGVLLVSRMVSLGSVMAALTMPLFLFEWYKIFGEDGALLGIRMPIALLMGISVIAAHIPNIKRIYAGTEPRITFPWEKKKGEKKDKKEKNRKD